eukprot:8013229-Alexandrium_andersonii.AAC.1
MLRDRPLATWFAQGPTWIMPTRMPRRAPEPLRALAVLEHLAVLCGAAPTRTPVSYTHLRAHETSAHL